MSSRAASAWVKTTGMVVQHNMNAINSYNKLNANVAGMKKSSEKLSSGYRINRAGDDAAGLAVSEKMRSQIKGLNQAIRNSQDGINMIQTFEGAAQETHSILQRMKELATQSANGTYDNATDRAAIQLEFDQLNDELNQIADTDYNGTIVLNGGQMSDGTGLTEKANGVKEFDYAAWAEKVAADEAAAKAAAPIDLVAKGDYSTKAPDLDDSKYDQTKADALWTQAETDGYAAAANSNEIELTYTVSAVDADGKVTAFEAKYADGTAYGGGVSPAGTESNGGFADDTTGVNVVTDMIGAKVGDFVTVKYTKPAGKEQAPTNIGFTDSNKEGTGITVSGSLSGLTEDTAKAGTTITLNTAVDDTAWTGADKAAFQTAIKELDGATLVINFKGAAADQDLAADSISLNGNTLAVTPASGWGLKAAADDSGFTLTYDGKDIADVAYSVAGKTADTAGVTGSITAKIAVDGYRLASGEKPNASLTKGAATVAEEDTAVSNSNAFTNSTARLTYQENITLQVGARSKDAVNFTFKYNTDDSADMGKLEPNLNLSSRAEGLNTENLSLATAEDANYAIDQIDKAINKTSMVRATFGAIQNRLEHKITNLTTTTENLTEAESSIRDTDMASEMMNYTKFNILQQAAQSMLAQANQQPQSILQLLG